MKCFAIVFLVVFFSVAWANDNEKRVDKSAPKIESVQRDFGNDRFAAGNSVYVDKAVGGDLVAAGGEVTLVTSVAGDALLGGGNVAVNGKVAQNLYAAAGQLNVNDAIGRNARVAGGQVEFGPKSEVTGNLSAAGGQLTLRGNVKGYLQAAGGRVLIDGMVAGDVEATSGQVELGPNARIGGRFRYTSREALRRDPAAQIQGPVESVEPVGGWPVPANVEHNMGRRGGWVWTIGLLVIAAILVAALPNFYRRTTGTLRTRTAMSFLIGFVTLICVPVAALLFIFTIIGVPLGLLLILLYLIVLLIGYVSSGIAVGDWLLARFDATRSNVTLWRIAAAVLGVLLISLLARIPWLGGWIVFAALLAGIGALVLQSWQSREPVPTSTSA